MSSIQTFEQLKRITTAFNEFETVEQSTLPEYYKSLFPKYCQCGAEVILTEKSEEQSGYTQLQCCNPDCWVKMAHKFSFFMKSLGYKGFGSTSALTLYEQVYSSFEYPTFLYVFKLSYSKIESIMGDAFAQSFMQVKEDLATKQFYFKDLVAALGIPSVGKGSNLFDVVKNPTTLLSFLLKRKVNELCDIAGIKAPKTVYYLQIATIDVVTLFTEVAKYVLSTPSRELFISITGSVTVDGEALTRHQFLSKCESLTDTSGNPVYKLVETKAVSKLQYVVADKPSSSSKYELGKQLNCLITAQEFYDMLRKEVEQ